MSDPVRRRTLASLVHDEAPLAPRRAAAVLVPVARELRQRELHGRVPMDVGTNDVVLGADGSVEVDGALSIDGVPAAASLGRWLFELMVGRPPLSSEDAFEPHILAGLPRSTVALMARSCADAPGQWPGIEEWSAELDRVAGGQAPPPSPAHTAAVRRRAVLVALAVVALVAISVTVVLLAPRWWDAATSDEGLSGVVQRSARS